MGKYISKKLLPQYRLWKDPFETVGETEDINQKVAEFIQGDSGETNPDSFFYDLYNRGKLLAYRKHNNRAIELYELYKKKMTECKKNNPNENSLDFAVEASKWDWILDLAVELVYDMGQHSISAIQARGEALGTTSVPSTKEEGTYDKRLNAYLKEEECCFKLLVLSKDIINNVSSIEESEGEKTIVKLFKWLAYDTAYVININKNDKYANEFYVLKKSYRKILIIRHSAEIGYAAVQIIMTEDEKAVEQQYIDSTLLNIIEESTDQSTKEYKQVKNEYDTYYSDCYNIVLSMAVYVSEILKRKPKKSVNKQNNTVYTTEVREYKDESMIRIYDVNTDTENGVMSFGGYMRTHAYKVEKVPHVRRGHLRHLKDGRVIQVKSSIIHKDKYNGFEVGDRLIGGK